MPREGHDVGSLRINHRLIISIHVPREGHDSRPRAARRKHRNFNPRAPRGARPARQRERPTSSHFNPRAPRGARRERDQVFVALEAISIHVPREGHDQSAPKSVFFRTDFNPRAPRGARRRHFRCDRLHRFISIHVPREGHDCRNRARRKICSRFQSTCPARGTTGGNNGRY